MTIRFARSNSSIVGIVAAWAVVLGVSAAAQLLAPSGVPPAAGTQPLYRTLPKAWLRVAVKFAPVQGANTGGTTTIELTTAPDRDRHERVLASAEFRSPADLESLSSDRALSFDHVPTEEPVWLRITIRSNDAAPLCTYAKSYVLHFPDKNRVASRGAHAFEESGYLGDFAIDHV